MMTSDNYSTPRKYKVDASDGHLFQKDGERKDTKSYIDDNTAAASHSTDLCGAESGDSEAPSASNGRRTRGRRSKDVVDDETPIPDDTPVAGATAQVSEKPKSLKKEKTIGSSSKKRKERKNLREKRRSTGVVIMPGADVSSNVC